jgi:hypothetical protein
VGLLTGAKCNPTNEGRAAAKVTPISQSAREQFAAGENNRAIIIHRKGKYIFLLKSLIDGRF